MSPASARRSLVVLLAIMLAVQPVAMAIGTHYLQVRGSPGNPWHQWQAYRRDPAPTVLFIGDSRIRRGIDVTELETLVGTTAAAIGVDAAKPHFLAAMARRIAVAPIKPRVVVIGLSEYQYNATWDADPVSLGGQSTYFWQLGELDAQYLAMSLEFAPDRGHLAAGWLVPLFAHYRVIIQGVRCDLLSYMRRSDCDGARTDVDRPMDAGTRDKWYAILREQYLREYFLSAGQVRSLRDAVDTLRRSGVDVRLLILPTYRVAEQAPADYRRFREGIGDVARELQVPLIDLHAAFDDRADLFADPNHLTRAGARALADRLAAALGIGAK